MDDGVLVLRRIHVRYRLRLDEDADHDAVERAFARHMDRCPVYRSLRAAVGMTTELVVDPT